MDEYKLQAMKDRQEATKSWAQSRQEMIDAAQANQGLSIWQRLSTLPKRAISEIQTDMAESKDPRYKYQHAGKDDPRDSIYQRMIDAASSGQAPDRETSDQWRRLKKQGNY